MKIFFAVIFLIGSNWAFASGIMIRPPVLDPCQLDPDSDRCAEANKEANVDSEGEDFEEMEAEMKPPPVKKKKIRRPRRKNPCRVDRDSDSCKRWIRLRKKRKRFYDPCRRAPKSKACLKKRAQQRDEG